MSRERQQKIIHYLQEFGYTKNESAFLYLVGTHSGYFFQKHYAEFLGIRQNGKTTALIRKAMRKGCLEMVPYIHGNYKLYHLCSKMFYSILGDAKSALRNYTGMERACAKLMITTFVVAMKDKCFLDTEAEKIEYFTHRRNVSRPVLPMCMFVGRNGQKTAKCFAEGFPILLENEGQPDEHPVFTYFEYSASTVQGFRTFLERYRPLLRELNGTYRVMFLAESDGNFERARRQFARVLEPGRERDQLLQCFVQQRAAKVGRVNLRERARELLRKVEGTYAPNVYQTMYEQWLSSGKIPEEIEKRTQAGSDAMVDKLETALLVI